MITTIYPNPKANITNGDTLRTFPLKSEMRQKCALSLLPFNSVLGVLMGAGR